MAVSFADDRRRRVAYFYDPEIANAHFGDHHPMKPQRVRMTHSLIHAFDLHRHLDVFRPAVVDGGEMTRFHSDDYIHFLSSITPDNAKDHLDGLRRYAVGDANPVFDGMFEHFQLITSGSLGGAALLNDREADIVINWSGGMHHARKSSASGFCYVNDCVLAILELLKVHRRVLYIDIDIHHGDGVEEAFYRTDRVMTMSFHKFGDFFPGTGDWRDIGVGAGRNLSVNAPLREGMDDESYRFLFRPLVAAAMERFQPEAVVLQCGADSLAGDRLGCFNLSIQGHADCVAFVRSFNLPTLVLGGGGYTIRNVARCWTYETAVCLGADLPDAIPDHEYAAHYAPTFSLTAPITNQRNLNDRAYLERLRSKLLEVIREIDIAPGTALDSVQVDAALEARTSARVRGVGELVGGGRGGGGGGGGGGGEEEEVDGGGWSGGIVGAQAPSVAATWGSHDAGLHERHLAVGSGGVGGGADVGGYGAGFAPNPALAGEAGMAAMTMGAGGAGVGLGAGGLAPGAGSLLVTGPRPVSFDHWGRPEGSAPMGSLPVFVGGSGPLAAPMVPAPSAPNVEAVSAAGSAVGESWSGAGDVAEGGAKTVESMGDDHASGPADSQGPAAAKDEVAHEDAVKEEPGAA